MYLKYFNYSVWFIRHRLKEELKTANKALEDIYNQNLTDQAKFNRKTQNLQMEIENKDLEVQCPCYNMILF